MNISGRHYTEDDAYRRLVELKAAVDRVPLDAPLRPYFDFLIGYIEALGIDLDDARSDQTLLQEARRGGAVESLSYESLLDLRWH